jgi:hypothetical protein
MMPQKAVEVKAVNGRVVPAAPVLESRQSGSADAATVEGFVRK